MYISFEFIYYWLPYTVQLLFIITPFAPWAPVFKRGGARQPFLKPSTHIPLPLCVRSARTLFHQNSQSLCWQEWVRGTEAGERSTRWSTTRSSNVNLPRGINSRPKCGKFGHVTFGYLRQKKPSNSTERKRNGSKVERVGCSNLTLVLIGVGAEQPFLKLRPISPSNLVSV